MNVLCVLSVCEGGEDGDGPPAGDKAAEQAVKIEAAADSDARPSTTTSGEDVRDASVCPSLRPLNLCVFHRETRLHPD